MGSNFLEEIIQKTVLLLKKNFDDTFLIASTYCETHRDST